MGRIRKFSQNLLLVALGGLLLTGAIALVAFVGRHPRASALVLAALFVALIVIGVVVRPFAPRVARNTILELDLREPPREAGSRGKVAELNPNKQLTLDETIEVLQRAAGDSRIAGLIVRPRFGLAPRATLDELRDAIIEFRKSGKLTIAIADSFGEGGAANGAYALATACGEIVVQESGYVGLTHLSAEGNFYPDLLARAGVAMEVFGRGKYKSAPNRFTERGFTAPDREQTKRMLDNFWAHNAALITEARGVEAAELDALAAKGPLRASEALEAGLIDRIAFPDEAIADVKQRVGNKASLLYAQTYKKRAGKKRTKGKTVSVAVIRAAGEIRRSAGTMPVGMTGGPVLTPDTLAPHLRAAVKDKSVKAVVLRIDSPGGSALASDTIWRELMMVRAAGKPVVASMASVAASGGYYIAAAADKIVAEPTTVTGSIGVFGMRPIIGEAKAKLDVHTDEVHTGKSPSPFSPNRKTPAAFRKRIDADIDAIYELFMKRVGDGRGLDRDQVFEVAQGRVWTGADAVEAGLVDELGGLDHALALAASLTDAPAGATAKPKLFPRKGGGVSMLKRRKPESSEDVAAAAEPIGRLTLEGLGGVVAHLGFDPRMFWVR
ncbi:MAG: protease [Actinomycetota bacterium]|jgi:protease-4